MRESLKMRRDVALTSVTAIYAASRYVEKADRGAFGQTIPLSMLFEEAFKQHGLINPGSLYNQAGSTHIRFLYGYESLENLRSGIKELVRIIEARGRKQGLQKINHFHKR